MERQLTYFSSYTSRLIHALSARPVAFLVTIVCRSLFILHARGTLKVDAYAIVLLALAALPWSLPAFNTVVDAIGDALVKANIKSLQIGGIKAEQIEKKLDEQRRILDDLILYSMAFHIYDKLKHLYLGIRRSERAISRIELCQIGAIRSRSALSARSRLS
jgi:hypothetical protein